MAYRIRITGGAKRSLRKLPRDAQDEVRDAIDSLAGEPRPRGARSLTGYGLKNVYRVRVGSYRIAYQVDDDELVVLVLLAGHRRDIYERLRRLL